MIEEKAERSTLANHLMRVGIVLAVVLPGYAIGYGAATGSPAPFDWDVAAVPGAVVAIAATIGELLNGSGRGPSRFNGMSGGPDP